MGAEVSCPRSPLRDQLDELYRWSSGSDALVLVWAIRLCDEGLHQSRWPDEIRKRGGPTPSTVRTTLHRLGVQGL